jgi:parallel beta-helix repeat protein
MNRFAPLALLLVVAATFAALGANEARAGAIVVSSTENGGPQTLRAAILDANAGSSADVITFDPAVFPPGSPATIALTEALPEVDGSNGVTIDGSNAGVIIDASGLDTGEGGLLVTSGNDGVGNVTIRNITVQSAPGTGVKVCGGELPDCTKDVGSVVIDTVTSAGNGGDGFWILGDQVNDVDFMGCESTDNADIGIHTESDADTSRVTVEDCISNGNGDMGIFVESISAIIDLTVRDSRVSDNATLGFYTDSVDETVRPTIDNVVATNNGQMGLGFNSAQPLTGLVFTDSQIDGNGATTGNGLGTEVLAYAIEDATITGNSFSNNQASSRVGGVGLQIYSQFEHPSNVTIMNNVVMDNVGRGITVYRDTELGTAQPDQNLISENEVSGNTWDGIAIFDAIRVTISNNQIFENDGIGINLGGGEDDEDDQTGVTPNDIGDGDDGSNTLLNFPVITGASADSVQGTACNGCTVELFLSDDDPSDHGEGRTFIGDAVAAGGQFSIPLTTGCEGDKVTATATDDDGNTSEFSANYTLTQDTDSCAPPLLWGDSDCSGAISSRDNQALLRNVLSQAPLSQTEPCPNLGETVDGRVWGDWDCNGAISARDNQALLRNVLSQLPLSQTEPCPDVGGTT